MSTTDLTSFKTTKPTEKFFFANDKNYHRTLMELFSSDFNLLFSPDTYHDFVMEMLDGINDEKSKIHKEVVGTLVSDLYNKFCKYIEFKKQYGDSEEFTETYPNLAYIEDSFGDRISSITKRSFYKSFYENWDAFSSHDDLVYFISKMLQCCDFLHVGTTSGGYLLMKAFSDPRDDIDFYNSHDRVKQAFSFLSRNSAMTDRAAMSMFMSLRLLNKIKRPRDGQSLVRLPLSLELDYVKNNSEKIADINEKGDYYSFVISPECFENLPDEGFVFLSKYVDRDFGVRRKMTMHLSSYFFRKDKSQRVINTFLTQNEKKAYNDEVDILMFFSLVLKMKL